jgi:AAA family ATP:ADP antiporter
MSRPDTSGQPPARTGPQATSLDRFLSLFADVRAGEGITALLMLANIFLLLVCYSIIKTVREPLVLLGGGAEVRSYAAAGQAILLMGFVPLYSWVASKARRMTLVVGATVFFIVCIELFTAAVTARVPYVGVAFFIWVGIFNISLIAQFWSFATDLYSKESGARLFPIIAIGMTAGAPLGSLVAARLFRSGLAPEIILQVSAVLLALTAGLYLLVNRRESGHAHEAQEALPGQGGFALVLGNPYLRLIAVLIVLLNVVNTTGEYLIARLLSAEVQELAAANPLFDKQAYIGAFTGSYQFWVGVAALLLQAFVTSRLVKYRGLAGVLLALPLIALGGYAIVAAGAGFALVRWVKVAENATDYSIMNTARQMLWLPTTREEKYKAKQAIDTFFVRGGDVLSAAVVYGGTHLLQLTVEQFALANIALTLVWLALAVVILKPEAKARAPRRRWAAAMAALALVTAPAQSSGQTVSADAAQTREGEWASRQADKASKLRRYEPDALERHIRRAEGVLRSDRPVYAFIGSAFEGGGLAVGPGFRRTYGDSGTLNAHAAWSSKNYRATELSVGLPEMAGGKVKLSVGGRWLDAPDVAFYGASRDERHGFGYTTTSAGASARVQPFKQLAFGGGFDLVSAEATSPCSADSPTCSVGAVAAALDVTYGQSKVFVEVDTRATPGYTTGGGFYRADLTDYRDTGGGRYSFRRMDLEAQRFIPIFRDSSVIALRGLVSTTTAGDDHEVPFFLMPALGGHSFRGYPSWRFRDRHRVLVTGEYRWAAGPFVDMGVFMDAGSVAPEFGDLDLGHLRTSHGVGLSFHTPSQTALRVELARSREGVGLLFSFSPRF